MGFWSGLGKVLGIAGGVAAAPFTGGASLIPTVLGAAGQGLGAISQSQANNRGEKYAGQLDLQQLLMARDQQNYNNALAREQEGRAGTSDAWRKLLSAQHTLSPAIMPNVSPYGAPQRHATGAEQTGADALTQQVLARLQGGNPIPAFNQTPLTVDPNLLNPGLFERISGYASPALSFLGRTQVGARPNPNASLNV